MQVDVGVIGGTGIGDRLSALGGTTVHVPTSYGVMRGVLLEHDGVRLFLIKRHSAGHKTPPHKVNYKAFAEGMKLLGAKICFASAAVGSLRAEWGAGTFVACSDFLDLTYRNFTMFDRTVEHRDFTDPMAPIGRNALIAAAKRSNLPIEEKGVYIGLNGPRYETPHEIQMLKHIGDVVGMTASSEAVCMREAGVPYSCLAVVTNLAAGISETPLNHEEVVEVMQERGGQAVQLFLDAAKSIVG
jgi:5'-methylthioadenosine phosphorylase